MGRDLEIPNQMVRVGVEVERESPDRVEKDGGEEEGVEICERCVAVKRDLG